MLPFRVATASCFIRGGDASRDSGGGASLLKEPLGKRLAELELAVLDTQCSSLHFALEVAQLHIPGTNIVAPSK